MFKPATAVTPTAEILRKSLRLKFLSVIFILLAFVCLAIQTFKPWRKNHSSSQTDQADKRVEPLRYDGDRQLAKAKLLRVLEEREAYPLGAGKPVKVDARIIAASNKALEEELAQGRFQ